MSCSIHQYQSQNSRSVSRAHTASQETQMIILSISLKGQNNHFKCVFEIFDHTTITAGVPSVCFYLFVCLFWRVELCPSSSDIFQAHFLSDINQIKRFLYPLLLPNSLPSPFSSAIPLLSSLFPGGHPPTPTTPTPGYFCSFFPCICSSFLFNVVALIYVILIKIIGLFTTNSSLSAAFS